MSPRAGWEKAGGILGGIIALMVVVAIGYVIARLACGPTSPATDGPVTTVPDTAITADRPKPAMKLPERIFRRRVPPKVQVTAGRPDSTRIRAFAAKVRENDSLRAEIRALQARQAAGDTAADPSSVRLPTPVLPPTWGSYDGRTLRWSITRSDGSIMRATARVRPRFDFMAGLTAGTDTIPEVREDRWLTAAAKAVPRCAAKALPFAGGGAIADREDRLRGAVVAGTAALLGCVLD
jgi:hypothetical protein